MRTLEEQRTEYANRKFLAMPLAGLIIWFTIGILDLLYGINVSVWAIFIGTGITVYLGMFLSKFTGEDFMDRSKPKNTFDTLFMMFTAMSILVYAIAIPFFIMDYTSLPLSVGILSGLMWFPFSWIIKHWVGVFHTMFRTLSIVVLWYLFPENRFTAIPFAIVVVYILSIIILLNRKRVVV